MARSRSTRRRRRGRFSFLLKLLCFALVLSAMVAALTLFFKADVILVEGNARYTNEQIIEASGLQIGDNLYLMNKYAHAQEIFRKLPYVERAAINRKLPDTLLIEVHECAAAAAVSGQGGTWLMSVRGKLLEQSDKLPENCVKVSGCLLVDPVESGEATVAEEEAYKLEVLKELLLEAEKKNMLSNVDAVDLGDDSCLQFSYAGRFTVKLPWNADIAYKLESLATVVDYLELNETGVINLITDGKASFIPE
ncbi:MAG: FtsQ-type POTRA domain-containing protein [Eubacteriales bacterium]|nr:FtsQ-type POTRA domain-containing protein [Eubacteriales bacterium]